MRSLVCLLLVGCSGAPPADSDTVPLEDVPYGDTASGWRSVLTSDGSDFECVFEEETCPTDCAGNVAPELSEPVMIVNGVPSDDVHIGDHVLIRVAYSDADCNIACGSASYGYTTPEDALGDIGSLCSNQPCAGETGFVLGVVTAGEYTWNVRMSDACGGQTNNVEGGFSL